MGYEYSILDADIVVLKEKMSAVENAIREYNADLVKNKYRPQIDEEKNTPLLEQVADYNCWIVEYTDEGVRLHEPRDATKDYTFTEFLFAISVGFKDGSYFDVKNDDGIATEYTFHAGEVSHVYQRDLDEDDE